MYKACAYVLSKNFGSTYRLHCFGAVPKVKAYDSYKEVVFYTALVQIESNPPTECCIMNSFNV